MDRMQELDELIAAKWGHVPGVKIPANWRELEPPKIPITGSCWGEGYDQPDIPKRKVRRPRSYRLSLNEQWLRQRQA